MGHLLFHRRAVAQTHPRALSYVLYLSLLWFGVVWSDLHEDGLVSCLIESVALLPDCLGSSQKSAASTAHYYACRVLAASSNKLPRTPIISQL